MTQQDRLWNSNYVKVWVANFMIFFSFMIVTPLLPLYLSENYQADKDTIGFVLSGYTLTALLARPFSGYLVDSFPRKVVLLTAYFLFFAFFAGYLLFAAWQSPVAFYGAALIIGLGNGHIWPGMQTMFINLALSFAYIPIFATKLQLFLKKLLITGENVYKNSTFAQYRNILPRFNHLVLIPFILLFLESNIT